MTAKHNSVILIISIVFRAECENYFKKEKYRETIVVVVVVTTLMSSGCD